MSSNTHIRSLFAAVAAFVGVHCSADDWPQYQGLNRDGRSAETGLARSWPADGPPELWQQPVGPGYGGAAVRDGEVYLLDRVDGEDVLRCFGLVDGEEKWRWSNAVPGRLSPAGSRVAPTVGPERIYALGGFGHLYCIDRKTRDAVWTVDLGKQFEAGPPDFGWSVAPLLHDDYVIVSPTSGKAGLAALNAATGEVVWTTPAIGGPGYNAPLLWTGQTPPVIVYLSTTKLVAVNPEDGVIAWEFSYGCSYPIPPPTVISDSRLFVTGGYKAGSVMLEVTTDGDGPSISEVFRLNGKGGQMHSAILHEGYLYANFNTNENERNPEGLVCLDMAGGFKWKTGENPAFERGALLLADNLIYALNGDNGELRLIEPSPAGYKELARAKVLEAPGKEVWAPMALSDGRLLVRDHAQLKCLDVRAR